jgi:peptidoglycan hydrolase CwlO-like protein
MILSNLLQGAVSTLSSEHGIEAAALTIILTIFKLWDKYIGRGVHKATATTLNKIDTNLQVIRADVRSVDAKVDRLDGRVGRLEQKREDDLQNENERLQVELDRARSNYHPHPNT